MGAEFSTTQWSQVLAARDGSDTQARKALADLCETYWYPLYVYVRRQGYDPGEAEDLTQAYFAALLEKEYLQNVDASKGRFRSFLLASLRHFLSHEWQKARTIKRGGSTTTVSLDREAAEARYALEPADEITLERIFERRWALTVLERTLDQLADQATKTGIGDRFETLKQFLTGSRPQMSYRQVASDLETTEEAVKGAVHRLRKAFGGLLRDEIAATVVHPEEIDDEVRHLLLVIRPWEPERA